MRKRWMLWLWWEVRMWPWAALVATALIAVHGRSDAAGPEDSRPSAPSSATLTTVPLEYRETHYRYLMDDLLFRDVPVEVRSSPFAKEPELGTNKVVRGVLKFGGSPSNAVPFLWQLDAKKLLLDLNRNQDLTDDADGVFAGRTRGPPNPSVHYQAFTNIHLAFPATSAGAPMLLDIAFLQIDGRGRLLVNVMERSYWQGRVTVAGQDWELGLLQNLSDHPGSFEHGQLLLRPWAEQNQAFYGWSASADSWAMPFEYRNRALKAATAFELSRQVFFAGHAWRLDWNAEPAANKAPFAVRLTEQHPPLGELQITGRFVERVVLTGGPYAVVLVRPGESVAIPAGSYNQPSVWLKQGEVEAYFNSVLKSGRGTEPDDRIGGGVRPVSGVAEAGKVVAVTERKPTVLTVGGPLTNAIRATRYGQNLNLGHRLIGAGGGEYKVWEYWRTQRDSAPEFAIYKGDKRLATGKFEFG